MTTSFHKNILRNLPGVLLIFIGAVYCFLTFNIPLLGDDLGFFSRYAEENDGVLALPRFMYRQWLWNNGRFADMLSPVWLNISPLWLTAIFTGFAFATFYWFTIRLATCRVAACRDRNKWSSPEKVHNSFYKILIIFIITFTFRWDAIWMEFMTIFGYVYASAFCLAALWLFLNRKVPLPAWLYWVSIPFCFIAAAMHEAAGFPLAAGLGIYLLVSHKVTPSLREGGISEVRALTSLLLGESKSRSDFVTHRWMAGAFILGGIFPLTSAPSWGRVGGMLQPEPIWEMLTLSAGWLCVLVIVTVIIAIRNPQKLRSLIRSPWVIFTSASIISCGFMLMSQFGGRTGWFCQLYALIALFMMLPQPKRDYICLRIMGWLMAAAVALHLCAVALWQHKLAEESRTVIEEYKKSEDGIVYFDYINEPELPWYLLRKTHGVPDDDDTYYRYRMGRHYGHGKPLVILPSKARNIVLENLTDSVSAGRFIISPDSLGNTYPDAIADIFPRRMLRMEETEYIQIPFEKAGHKFYLYAPTDRDPGEK